MTDYNQFKTISLLEQKSFISNGLTNAPMEGANAQKFHKLEDINRMLHPRDSLSHPCHVRPSVRSLTDRSHCIQLQHSDRDQDSTFPALNYSHRTQKWSYLSVG